MEELLPVILGRDLQASAPGIQIHAFLFQGARIGLGHRGLDTLRRRVLQRARERLAQQPRVDLWPEIRAAVHLLPDRYRGHAPSAPFVRDVHGLAEGRPFPVENDAVDGARLLSLFMLRPVFILDARALKPPLIFLPCPAAFVLPTPGGPVSAPGVPVLTDREKALRSLLHAVPRSPATEMTRTFLLLLLDPGQPAPVDKEETIHRVENWMGALTSANLAQHTVDPP